MIAVRLAGRTVKVAIAAICIIGCLAVLVWRRAERHQVGCKLGEMRLYAGQVWVCGEVQSDWRILEK